MKINMYLSLGNPCCDAIVNNFCMSAFKLTLIVTAWILYQLSGSEKFQVAPSYLIAIIPDRKADNQVEREPRTFYESDMRSFWSSTSPPLCSIKVLTRHCPKNLLVWSRWTACFCMFFLCFSPYSSGQRALLPQHASKVWPKDLSLKIGQFG